MNFSLCRHVVQQLFRYTERSYFGIASCCVRLGFSPKSFKHRCAFQTFKRESKEKIRKILHNNIAVLQCAGVSYINIKDALRLFL